MAIERRADQAAQQRASASAGRLLAAAAIAVGLAFLALAEIGARRAEGVAARASAAHLEAVRAGAEAAATAAWARLEADVQRLAGDAETVQALRDLAEASRASETDPRLDAAALAAPRAALAAHLTQWYAPLGENRPPFDDAIGMPAARRAQWLQAQYIAGAGQVTDGPYADAHARWHPRLAAIAADAGMRDLLLVRASDGLVVYDVAKMPVFQTSLVDGAFADSRLAALFRRARGASGVTLSRADFAAFAPARGEALAFVAAPLLDGGEFVGAVVAAYTPAPLERALSAGGSLSGLGLGAAGDVVLIGSDGALRTTPRQARSRDAAEPTLPTPAVLTGSEGGPLEYEIDGRSLLASVGAPGFGELGWRVVALRDADEAHADAAATRRALFLAAIGLALVVIGALAALVWWGALPLRHLAGAMARLRLNDPRARVPVLGHGEAAAIALQVNGLLEQHRAERAATRQQHEREVRTLAEAVDTWMPGEATPRLSATGELAPIGTALLRLADRLDDARRSAPLIPPPAVEALRAAAEQLRRDAERNLEALGAAEEATRDAGQRRERAMALSQDALAGSESAANAARAEQATVRHLAAALARPDGAGDDADVGGQTLAALGSGAAAAAALVDELSVLAVNAALPGGAADDALAESARIAVERAEQVGTELDGTLAAARAALAARVDTMPTAMSLAAVEREIDQLVDAVERARRGAGDLDAELRGGADERIAATVHAAVDSARRLRQTAELVASEAAAVAGGPATAES